MTSTKKITTLLKKTAPARLVGRGRLAGFQLTSSGRNVGNKLRGLTKALSNTIFSSGVFPVAATHGSERRLGWKGTNGGRARGKAVDAQLSSAVNRGALKPQKGQYVLVKLLLVALHELNIVPLVAQRTHAIQSSKLCTASDIIGLNTQTKRLVVIELKCGFSGKKTMAALNTDGSRATMNGVDASDTLKNRHMLQLACTHAMFMAEKLVIKQLRGFGVKGVDGMLLYASNDQVETSRLSKSWRARAEKVLRKL